MQKTCLFGKVATFFFFLHRGWIKAKVLLISDCNNLFGIVCTQLIEFFHLLRTATLQFAGCTVKRIKLKKWIWLPKIGCKCLCSEHLSAHISLLKPFGSAFIIAANNPGYTACPTQVLLELYPIFLFPVIHHFCIRASLELKQFTINHQSEQVIVKDSTSPTSQSCIVIT